MSEHDTTHLQELARRRQKLVTQLEALDVELEPEIYAAAPAGVPQIDIIRWTGLARESVRLKSMSPEQREELRQRRRKG
jgi:hypothetical protein